MFIVELILMVLMVTFWVIGALLYPFKWICETMFLSVDALWIAMGNLERK